MTQQPGNLIWIDLEMTGLNPDKDRIIEIATIITDSDLHLLEEGPALAIHQTDAVLAKMDDWNQTQHGKTGLTARVRKSRIDEAQAERLTLDFIKKHVRPDASPMCGNSICQDRRFLWRYMPELERYFHYRNLDVSTLKELAKRWVPTIAERFYKDSDHLALDDIRESIRELQYYRDHLLGIPKSGSPA